MHQFNGKEKIGELNGVPVNIDWDFLNRDFGRYREIELMEKSAGYFLRACAALILLVLALTEFYSGFSLLEVLLSPASLIVYYLFLYSA
jgi:hypothetical protein